MDSLQSTDLGFAHTGDPIKYGMMKCGYQPQLILIDVKSMLFAGGEGEAAGSFPITGPIQR